jgi:hypothetical protein
VRTRAQAAADRAATEQAAQEQISLASDGSDKENIQPGVAFREALQIRQGTTGDASQPNDSFQFDKTAEWPKLLGIPTGSAVYKHAMGCES